MTEAPSIAPPTPVAKLFVKYVLGFGVGVAAGLAVYLGKLNVPLFAPLLQMIPDKLQPVLIPLSSALMGTIAVVIQFYSQQKVTQKLIKPLFARYAIGFVVALLAFMTVQSMVAVRIETVADQSETFLVGFSRPLAPPCPAGVSDEECIKRLTFNTGNIASFWGKGSIVTAQLALQLTYLATTGIFGALIGLVILTTVKKS
jgi:hypothetical protein